MDSQTITCGQCKSEFILTEDDFVFYTKLQVAAPRICPNCQLQRRLAFRNERTLYQRKDSKEQKPIISTFSPDKFFLVYPQEMWWGDSWDPMESGHVYDFSRPFFEQLGELFRITPWPALFNVNGTNSEFCNYTTDNKNCYLVFGGDYNENCAYGSFNMRSKDSLEMYFVEKMELCYEITDSADCYKVLFAQYVTNCSDSVFLYACNNCTNCLGCVNLKNKQYCILNQQYSKEEYEAKVKALDLGKRENLEAFRLEFETLKARQPHKYAAISNAEASSGDNLSHVKNCVHCFETYEGAEDCKNLFLAGWNLKDSRNADHVGHGAELVYDSLGTFGGCSNVRHSYFNMGSYDLWYSAMCKGSNNLFGCFGLRHKSFCIFNTQYSEKEYHELLPKIIQHMKDIPYVGKDGYTYTFGDFLPVDFSPFSYNESVAQEYFPLTKEQATEGGFQWKDMEVEGKAFTVRATDLPSHISETQDSILKQVIACEHGGSCLEQCTKVFRIIPSELEFYRQSNLPIPRTCPNCRHYSRMKRRNPIKLWKDTCGCNGASSKNGQYTNGVSHFHEANSCPNEFETTHAPEKARIVYCADCYNAETI